MPAIRNLHNYLQLVMSWMLQENLLLPLYQSDIITTCIISNLTFIVVYYFLCAFMCLCIFVCGAILNRVGRTLFLDKIRWEQKSEGSVKTVFLSDGRTDQKQTTL